MGPHYQKNLVRLLPRPPLRIGALFWVPQHTYYETSSAQFTPKYIHRSTWPVKALQSTLHEKEEERDAKSKIIYSRTVRRAVLLILFQHKSPLIMMQLIALSQVFLEITLPISILGVLALLRLICYAAAYSRYGFHLRKDCATMRERRTQGTLHGALLSNERWRIFVGQLAQNKSC